MFVIKNRNVLIIFIFISRKIWYIFFINIVIDFFLQDYFEGKKKIMDKIYFILNKISFKIKFIFYIGIKLLIWLIFIL